MTAPRTLRDSSNEDIRLEITRLETEISDYSHRAADATTRAIAFRAEVGRRTQRLNECKQEIERRQRPAPEPRVSEHALLRYIERVMDIDVEAVRASILTENVVTAINAGASGVTVNGVKFVVQGAVIVTTLGDDQRVKRKDRRRVVEVDADTAIAAGLDDYDEQRSAANGGTP